MASKPSWVSAATSFQSSPPPKERCNGVGPRAWGQSLSFNPHRPRRSGAIQGIDDCASNVGYLSILTAPEGAVQFATRLWDKTARLIFQSSPPPKERCNEEQAHDYMHILSLSILTAPEGAVQSGLRHKEDVTDWVFQSSPPPKERCNQQAFEAITSALTGLSILTAPEGAVQFSNISAKDRASSTFQSSPPPKERCNSTSYNSLFLPDLQGGFRRPLRTES